MNKHKRSRFLCSVKNYLEQTKLPIQVILEKVGYSDKTFFFKLSKKNCGMSPDQYRKKNKVEEQM